jgi:predicted nucleic acid-binding protein
MKILLDTNIILDIALNRQGHSEKAKELIYFLNQKEIPFFVTATTVTDIYYVLKKSDNHTSALEFLQNFLLYADVAGVDKTIIIKALKSGLNDFEDAVQIQSAVFNQISTIVTRNKSDFKTSEVEVFTPEEFLILHKSK